MVQREVWKEEPWRDGVLSFIRLRPSTPERSGLRQTWVSSVKLDPWERVMEVVCGFLLDDQFSEINVNNRSGFEEAVDESQNFCLEF